MGIDRAGGGNCRMRSARWRKLLLMLLVALFTSLGVVCLTISDVSAAPVAISDAFTTAEDTALVVAAPGVLANDTNVDGPSLRAIPSSGPSHGTVILNGDGSFRYTPQSNYYGSDSFRYSVSDGARQSSTVAVNLTVTPVNDAPSGITLFGGTVPENVPLGTQVGWFTTQDPETTTGFTYTLSGEGADVLEMFNVNYLRTNVGLDFETKNTFTLHVRTTDYGGLSYERDFAITVTNVNEAPVAANDSYVPTEDVAMSILAPGVLANDVDVDSSVLTARLVSGPAHGSLTLNVDGSFAYTPGPDYWGPDSFAYEAWDGALAGAPATVTLTVVSANDVPSFTKGSDQTVLEDCGPTTIAGSAVNVSAGPSNETGQTLNFNVTNSNNSLFAVQPAVEANGTLTYTPAANQNGMVTVTLTLTDDATTGGPALTTASQTFTITVTAVNDAPVNTAPPSIAGTMNVGDMLTAAPGIWNDTIDTSVSGTSTLTFTYQWVRAEDASGMNAVDIASATSSSYGLSDPDAHKYLCVRVTCIDDGVGLPTAQSTTLSTPWTFQVINRPPSITEGASTPVSMDEDGNPLTWNLTLHATDADSDILTWSILTQALRGTAAATGTGTFKVITYIPTANYNGPDSFVVQVRDGYSGTDSTTVNVTVNPINDTPSFTGGADQTVPEDCGPQTVSGWATSITAGPADEAGQAIDFIVTNDNTTLFSTQPAVAANGTLTFTPAAKGNGTASVTVSIHDNGGTASDGVGTSAPQMFAITVTAVNDPPVDTYTLTYTAGANGMISGISPQTVNQGASGTLVIAVPNVGYHFVSWSDNNSTTAAARTDINVTANINVTAAFAINTYTIAASAGADGGISPSGNVTVNHGASQSFTVSPTMGYHVLDVLVDGSSVGAVTSYTFTNLTENHTIAATFAINTYVLAVDVTGSGSVAKSPGQTSYDHGTSVQLTATPATHWHFVGWSGDVTGSANPTIVIIDGNKTITATFAINMYTIVASVDLGGSISPSGNIMVNHGASQSFSITPGTGYHVLDVLVDGSSVGAVTSYTFTNLTENHTIAATFAIDTYTDTYTLTYTAGANGTISGTSPQTVNQGASGTTVTATPNVEYHFVSWSDGILTAARTDINVTANINATTTFAVNINTYTLTVSVSGSGSVAKSPDQSSYTDGTSVQLTATPAVGWHFVAWSGDLAGSTNSTTITMDASKTVTATYAPPVLRPVSGHTMVLTIGSKTMTVNGTEVALDAPAALVEDRTLVPLRAVVEHLGGSIAWNARTRQVTLKARGTTIILTIGKATALVNGKSLAIDPKNGKVVPLISSGRTLLPLRFVAESLGLQVGWDAKTRTITVSWED